MTTTEAMDEALIQSTLPNGLPERTLGWYLLYWASKYLRQPDGPDAGKPFMFTPEQTRLVLWWYAVDENGRFLFNSGVIRRMKGWGKDPFAAALCLLELAAPTQFSHFDEKGNPIGRSHPAPWIQVAAVSRDQTKNTFTLFPTMMSAELINDYGLEPRKEIIHKRGGGRIEAVTSAPRSLEGGRSHFVVLNETQFWLENNNGHEMRNAIQGNTAKGRGGSFRYLSICNAHRPGEDSVAELDYEAFQELMSEDALRDKSKFKFFYDAVEAPPGTDLNDYESLKRGIIAARGDATWLDVDRLIEEVMDPRTIPSEARRKYLNQIVAAEDAWLTPQQWDAIGNPLLKLRPDDKITLGFDGSRSGDHTALCACRVEDGAIFLLNVWNPENYPDGKVPTEEVDKAVRRVFNTYNVVAFRADVREFEAYIDKWSADYRKVLEINACPGNLIAYDMRSKGKREFLIDCERFESAVIEKEVQHDGNRLLRRHVLSARRRPSETYDLVGIGKESRMSKNKIDAAVTAVLAFGARQEYLKSKRNKKKGLAIF
ncbi:hypothetical protein JYB64_20930 [Algoriphagus aestuarii]|nr:hypothetical protein [Algoriphagus aestuarii]